ncbi:hypothetical protein [Homoserinimonas sp. OAct 916]|uniref:hypothetical protein n=1 Tax=Homoserinimonas sp. OAct 916 TaxID=2211450 RepID=UPI0013009DFD|nr:hypothetical protein [Homoserinimonas sp. OAct 916]
MSDMTTKRGRLMGAGAVVAVALLLAACAQAPAGLSPSASAVAQTPATSQTDPAETDAEPGVLTDPQPSSGPPSSDPNSTAPGSAPSDEACLAGKWKMDNDVFAKAMLAMAKAHPEAAKVTQDFRASGDRFLWFSGDGDYGATDDKFVLTTVGGTNGRTMEVVTTLDSARIGAYGAVDGFLWVAETETLFEDATMTVDKIQVSISTSLGGPTDVDLFGYTGQIPNITGDHNFDGVAIYRCAGNELELEVDGGIISRFTRTK